MQPAALFETRVEIARGHAWASVRVELGGEGVVEVTFEGREAPTVTYRFGSPEEAAALAETLLRAADVARRSITMEAG